MVYRPKVPIERRRKSQLGEMPGVFPSSTVTSGRRESDQIKARLEHWIELADKVIGKPPPGEGEATRE
jgi:hypothetical protein